MKLHAALLAGVASAFGMLTRLRKADLPPPVQMPQSFGKPFPKSKKWNPEPRQTRPPWRVGRVPRFSVKLNRLIGFGQGARQGIQKYNFNGTINPLWK